MSLFAPVLVHAYQVQRQETGPAQVGNRVFHPQREYGEWWESNHEQVSELWVAWDGVSYMCASSRNRWLPSLGPRSTVHPIQCVQPGPPLVFCVCLICKTHTIFVWRDGSLLSQVLLFPRAVRFACLKPYLTVSSPTDLNVLVSCFWSLQSGRAWRKFTFRDYPITQENQCKNLTLVSREKNCIWGKMPAPNPRQAWGLIWLRLNMTTSTHREGQMLCQTSELWRPEAFRELISGKLALL